MDFADSSIFTKLSSDDQRIFNQLIVKGSQDDISRIPRGPGVNPIHQHLYNFIDMSTANHIALKSSPTCARCQALGRLLALVDHYRGSFERWDLCDLLRQPTGLEMQPRIAIGYLSELREEPQCISCREIYEYYGKIKPDTTSDYNGETHDQFVEFRLESFRQPSLLVYTSNGPGSGETQIYTAFIGDRKPSAGGISSAKLVDPQWADLTQACKWLKLCNETHLKSCSALQKQPLGAPVTTLTLIDLNHNCLCEAPGDCRYIALSYVWGTPETFKATTENVAQLRHRGGLDSTETGKLIPKTVKDAMGMLSAMGERYLWVDRLCIIQDDEEHKTSQLKSMEAIFANSYFTLVAADGDNADSGMPGVGGGSIPRLYKQEILDFSPCCRLLLLSRNIETQVTDSVWSHRAWTFQEELLSRRLLIYVGGHLRWHCLEATWMEELHEAPSEAEGPLQRAEKLRVASRFSKATIGMEKSSPKQRTQSIKNRSLYHWARVVSAYADRLLTFENDKLNALGGIINRMSQSFVTPFHFGNPECYIHEALLWQPKSHQGGQSRQLQQNNRFQRNMLFPSWSWAGWTGDGIDWSHGGLGQYAPGVSPSVILYKVGSTGPKQPTRSELNRATNLVLEVIAKGNSASHISLGPYDESASRGSDNFPPPSDADDILISKSLGIDRRSHLDQYLFCQTSRVWLSLGRSPGLPPGADVAPFTVQWHWCFTENYHCLLDSEGQWAGNIYITNGDSELGQSCELIRLSAGHLTPPDHVATHVCRCKSQITHTPACMDLTVLGELYDWYNVLWIEWHEGVAYRKALGMVTEVAWLREKHGELKVLLG